jgi:hypothetical protein
MAQWLGEAQACATGTGVLAAGFFVSCGSLQLRSELQTPNRSSPGE